jgi:hypothetical protein
MIIGINCGHTVNGQAGSGAVGILNESDETRNVGYKLMDCLRANGNTVIDCTNDYADSTSANLAEIVRLANNQPLDLFVSIHFNSGGGNGVEVYTYGGVQHAEAVRVCDELHALGFVNRGVKDGSNLAVIRGTNAKAMLIEVCFGDTQSDAELYQKLGAQRVATAICMAIMGVEEDEYMTELQEIQKRLDELEQKVNKSEMIYNYIDANMPAWAREAVQWCVDKGIVKGTDESGSLGLNDDKLWVCVVLYRFYKLI